MNWRVLCGDCLTEMANFAPGSFDAVITDPPYGNGYYATDKADSVLPALRSIPRLVMFGYPERLVDFCRTAERTPDEWLCWWPYNAGAKPRPPGALSLRRESEHIAVFGMAVSIPMRPTENPKIAQTFSRSMTVPMGDVWRDASPGIAFQSHLRQHPNEKPLTLMRRLVATYTAEGETVLDPFCGSGTTGVACAELGRDFVGIEIDPGYVEIARRRIEAATRQGKLAL